MPIRIMLCFLVLLPAAVGADAGSGQFMGYELGARYSAEPQNAEVTTTGNLLIRAENPTKPDDITEVNLITTSESKTIGYIVAVSWHPTEEEAREAGRHYAELLRAKYPDWRFGRELLDSNLRIIEANFAKAPFNLQLRLERDEHQGRNMWRFSMGLGWQTESAEWRAWKNQATAELTAAKSKERKLRMKDADTRGL